VQVIEYLPSHLLLLLREAHLGAGQLSEGI